MEKPCGIFHEVSLLVRLLPGSQRPWCCVLVPSKEMPSSQVESTGWG